MNPVVLTSRNIGAFGEGSCGVISVDPKSWGEVKAAYRGEEGDTR
jgi:hypothetical protein